MSSKGFSGKTLHGYLVTGEEDPRMRLWATSCHVTNWLDLRDKTAHVMVFDENLGQFLQNAAQFGLTVQRIEGAGDDEQYTLLAGDEADGWTPQKALRYASAQAEEMSRFQQLFTDELLANAPGEWDGDEAPESTAVVYIRHLEDEVKRLGGDPRPPWCREGTDG